MGRWSLRSVSLVILGLVLVVRTLLDLRTILVEVKNVARGEAISSSSSAISSSSSPEMTHVVSSGGELVSSSSSKESQVKVPTKKNPQARVVRFLFCRGIDRQNFAQTLCEALDREGGPNLVFECVHETTPPPDYFFIDSGARSCDTSLPAEKQLHLRVHDGTECHHDATVLWTGVNAPGLCPNVLHVPAVLVERMMHGREHCDGDSLSKVREPTSLQSRDKFCVVSTADACSPSFKELIEVLGCEGTCGNPVVAPTRHKFVIVSESRANSGVLLDVLAKA